nr:hypothetical protein [Tanacetum cinerariifolium]
MKPWWWDLYLEDLEKGMRALEKLSRLRKPSK